MEKSTKTLTVDAEPELLTNVAKMNKMDFVDFYVASGYDREETGQAWHNLRRTPKVHKIMDDIRNGVVVPPAPVAVKKKK